MLECIEQGLLQVAHVPAPPVGREGIHMDHQWPGHPWKIQGREGGDHPLPVAPTLAADEHPSAHIPVIAVHRGWVGELDLDH